MRISVFFIVLWGSIIIFTAIFVYPWSIQPQKIEPSYDAIAFAFGSSERLVSNNSAVHMNFHSFELDEGIVEARIFFEYECFDSSTFDTAYFIFQIPYTLNDVFVNGVEVDYGGTTPEYLGGKTLIERTEAGLSCVIIQIPKINQTFGELDYIRLDLMLENVFRTKSHYEYELVLTTSSYFHDQIKELEIVHDIDQKGLLWNFRLYDSFYARLDLERIGDGYSLDLIPKSDLIGYWFNRSWYRWDIKSSISGILSCSIIANVVDENAKVFYETRIGLSWFSLGLLGPLFISSIYKFWEEPRLKIVEKTRPEYYHRTGKIGFYHLLVENLGKNMAYECEAHVTIKEEAGKKLFEFSAKWSATPEPLGAFLPDGKQEIITSLIPFSTKINLKSKMPQAFCILVKDNNEEECYGWNARSYLFGHKSTEWKLGLGIYVAEVEVFGGNVKKLEKFKIENNGKHSTNIRISKI